MPIGSHLKLNESQINYLNRCYGERVRTYGEGWVGMPVSHVANDVMEDLCEAADLGCETAESIVELFREHSRLVKNFQDRLEATRNGPNRYGSLSS